MSEINLLAKEDLTDVNLEKVKTKVSTITTVILAGYLVVMSGVLGWWWYSSNNQKKVSEELRSLYWQVAGKSGEDMLIRKLDQRRQEVVNFLIQRGNASDSAMSLINSEAVVDGWIYNLGGVSSVSVKSADQWSLSRYAENMSRLYSQVRYDSIEYDGATWSAELSLGGKK
jgi:hypothetical protein